MKKQAAPEAEQKIQLEWKTLPAKVAAFQFNGIRPGKYGSLFFEIRRRAERLSPDQVSFISMENGHAWTYSQVRTILARVAKILKHVAPDFRARYSDETKKLAIVHKTQVAYFRGSLPAKS